MENFWPSCLDRFQQELSVQQYNTWIKPLKCEIRPNALCLIAPNRFVLQWVKDRFLNKIEELAKEILSIAVNIEIVLQDNNSNLADQHDKSPVSEVVAEATNPIEIQKKENIES